MMKTRELLPAALVLAVSFAVHSNAYAAGVLNSDPSLNTNLASDTYVFAGTHTPGLFLDEFEFSLASPGNITATINNVFDNLPEAAAFVPKLFENKFLTLSLFDNGGNFITATGAGGTLSATGLNSGATYTLAISGKANGAFGGIYDGKLAVDAAPAVPLPAALPGFVAALMTLGLRRRKSNTTLEQ